MSHGQPQSLYSAHKRTARDRRTCTARNRRDTGACRGGFPGVSGNPFWISLLQLSASQIVYQLYLTKTISIIGKTLTIQ